MHSQAEPGNEGKIILSMQRYYGTLYPNAVTLGGGYFGLDA